MKPIRYVGVALIAALVLASLLNPAASLAATVVITPGSYTTTAGADGGQAVAKLQVQDQSGSQNNWNKYVEFTTPGSATYAGYRSYTVPGSVAPATVTAIQVQANFLGPAPADRTWTWRIYDWTSSAWVVLGTNSGASWSAWTMLTFNATGTLSNYINSSTSEIRIGLISNNTSDNADLDYEAVTLTTGAAGATATPTATRTATATATATPEHGHPHANRHGDRPDLHADPHRNGRRPPAQQLPHQPPARRPRRPARPTATATPNPGGTAYYVSTSGSNSNPGTLAAPWLTIQKAANSATAGSTVYVRGGTYGEHVTINVSGTSGSPITFQSYPGEQAVIDGTGIALSAGDNPLVDLNGRSYIVFKGFELRNNKTSTVNVVPIGIYVPGGSVGVELRNNLIHHIETNFTGTDGGDAHGIAVYGNTATAVSGLVIDGNELYNLKLGSSESLVVNGNVNGFQVTNNLVHDNNNIGIDAIGYEGVGPAGSDRARNGVIANNRVWNIESSTNRPMAPPAAAGSARAATPAPTGSMSTAAR